jgi:hypothetical protein
MEDLKRRKDEAVRKRVPEEWLTRSKLEGVKDEEDLIVAPRITEADKANDVRYVVTHMMGLSPLFMTSREGFPLVCLFVSLIVVICPASCMHRFQKFRRATSEMPQPHHAFGRSRKRALARRLYLLVKGPDGTWGFPQTQWKQGDKMRDTATRALEEHCGTGDPDSFGAPRLCESKSVSHKLHFQRDLACAACMHACLEFLSILENPTFACCQAMRFIERGSQHLRRTGSNEGWELSDGVLRQ